MENSSLASFVSNAFEYFHHTGSPARSESPIFAKSQATISDDPRLLKYRQENPVEATSHFPSD
jgi:hypothetical protein